MGRTAKGYAIRSREGTPFWHVRFSHLGRRFFISTGETDERKAHQAGAKIFAEIVGSKRSKKAVAGRVRLIDVSSHWIEEVRSARSNEWADTLELYAGSHWAVRWDFVSEITTESMQRYIKDRLRSVTTVTLHKELVGMRRFLNWAAKRGFVHSVPEWEAPKPQSDYRALCLTREECEAIIERLPSRGQHPKHKPVREYFAVVWATTFRPATMARLDWGDVDLEAGAINIRASSDKRRNARAVPLTDDAVTALRSMLPAIGLVFGKVRYDTSLKLAAKDAGIPAWGRVSSYTLRHSRLTWLASQGASITAIQHMAGHKTLATTQRYLHSSFDDAREFLERAGQRTRGGR